MGSIGPLQQPLVFPIPNGFDWVHRFRCRRQLPRSILLAKESEVPKPLVLWSFDELCECCVHRVRRNGD